MIKDRENALAGARCIIQNWLEAKESEVIHFITDESHKKEADSFELAAFECGVVPKISILSLDGVQSGEVIDKMKNTMYYSDVIVGATHYSFVTTEAVGFALKKGSRFLSFPMHTNDGSCIFEREFIRMSPKQAKKMGKPIAQSITDAKEVVVKTKKGINVAFSAKNRNAGVYPHIKGGFTHVPFIPEQVARRTPVAPYMALDDIRRGLEAAIAAIDKHFDGDIDVNGGKEF